MRYEDSSQTGSQSNELPIARDDSDALAAGARGPATGNVITGEGTQTGSIGADLATDGARITSISGADGTDTSFAGGKLSVAGEFGQLSVDANGNYSYLANKGAPETARDHFTYKLADSQGNSDNATLTIEIGKSPALVQAMQQIVPGPDGVVVLPAGVELSDIHVVGRNLVIDMPDGTQMVIVDGAVFVPQLVLDNVEVPATNLAALLIDGEPQPAAGGQPPSGGGNFAVPVGPLDPGVPLGDLIPPTELGYTPPEFVEVGIEEEEPNTPPIAANDAVHVSEEGLEGGLIDSAGTPDTTDSPSVLNGSILAGDEDGDSLAITLDVPTETLFSHNVEIEWVLSAGDTVLTGFAGPTGDTPVIVLTMHADGTYSVILSGPIDHPNDAIEDGLDFVVPVNISDGEAFVDVAITVTIEDDSPRTSAVRVGSSVTLDETDGANPLSSGASIVATSVSAMVAADVDYGADGAGAAPVYGLSLLGGVTSLLSNVQTALGDHPITLTLTSSTLITATYVDDTGTHTAFTIEMLASGQIKVTQSEALEHLDDGASAAQHDDALTLSTPALGNLVNATVTYEDYDGDHVSASAAIGGAITFKDDGPAIDVTKGSDAQITLTTFDEDTIGTDSSIATTSAAFGGAFAIGANDGGGDGTASVSALSYSLGTTGGLSGLSSHGVAINLYNVGGIIVGSTALAAPATATDASVIFSVSVSASGVVTLTQYSQIDHPAISDPDGTDAPFSDDIATLLDSSVTLTASATITDNDGDTDSDSETIDIGANLHFADDGPNVSISLVEGATLRVDETDGVTANVYESDTLVDGHLGQAVMAASLLFSTSFSEGADGATKSFSLSAAADGTASGLLYSLDDQPIVLKTVSATLVEGHVGTIAGALAFTVSIDPTTGAVTLTQYLAVEHYDNPDNYDEDSSGLTAGVLQVKVAAIDYDGDTDQDFADLGSIIRFEDDGPSIDVSQALPTDPEALLSLVLITGDEGTEGAGETSDSTGADFSGVFSLASDGGSDGAASTPDIDYSLGLKVDEGTNSGLESHDQDIYLYNIAGTIVGSTSAVEPATATDASVVFSLTVSGSGVVTLTQYQQIDHADEAPGAPDAPGESDAPFDDQLTVLGTGLVEIIASATITDNDGDIASDAEHFDLGDYVLFADDGPVITSARIGSSVLLDETDGASPLSAGAAITATSAAAMITAAIIDYGADGVGPAPVYGLSLLDGETVLLTDIATANGDHPITLTLTSSTLITATFVDGTGTHTAFTIEMLASGQIKVTQSEALEHSLDGSSAAAHDDPLTLDSAAIGNLVNATVTYQDFDGDTATATVAIGGAITFEDDGPTVNPTVSTQAAAIVDESPPVALDAINTLAVIKGNDPDLSGNLAIGSGSTLGPVINAGANFGADGPAASASLTYALSVISPTSGVTLTDGTAINLVLLANGVVVGVVAAGTFINQAAFAVSINSTTGAITVEQYLSLDHPTNPDQNESLSLGAGSLGATVKATDSDGDFVTSSAVDISSQISFLDDGPSATTEALQNVAEGASITGTFDFVAGADGGGVTHLNGTLLIFDPITGYSQSIAVDDGSIKAKADGTYQFTANASASGVTNGTFTVTDGDGDPVIANWSFNITDANAPTAGSSTALLDDDGLSGGNPAGGIPEGDINANAGEVATVNSSEAIFHGQLNFSFGGDGAGSINFAAMNGDPGVVGTENVVYSWNAGTLTLTATTVGGTRPGTLLFTLVLDDATSGKYTLTLNDNVLHAAGGDEASAPNVALTFTVLDSDNSPAAGADGTLNITFNDDMPTAAVSAAGLSVAHDETPGLQGDAQDVAGPLTVFAGVTNPGDDPHVAGTGPIGFALDTGAISTTGSNVGADGGTTVLSLELSLQGVDSGLNATDGTNILLYKEGSLIVGRVGSQAGPAAFAVAIAADGTISIVQYLSLQHPTGGASSPDEAVFIDPNVLFARTTVTDGDNDQATAQTSIGQLISFQDDGPSLSGVQAGTGVTLDETSGAVANSAGGMTAINATSASAVIAATQVFGADGAAATGSVTYGLTLTGAVASLASGLVTAVGDFPITLQQTNATTITGTYVNGGTQTAFTISIGTDGRLSVVLNVPLEHLQDGSAPADYNDSLNLAGLVNATITIKDGDNDTASGSTGIGNLITFLDDGPAITSVTTPLAIANSGTVSNTGNFAFTVGSDGPNAGGDDITNVTFSATVNNVAVGSPVITPISEDATSATFNFSFTYSTGPSTTATETGTLVFNKLAGTYTVDLANPIQAFSISQTATGTLFQGYEIGTSNPDNSQPDVSVTQIRTDDPSTPGNEGLFVQFTSVAEPSSGTGANNLFTTPYSLNGPGDSVANTFANGELFTQAASWVSTSNTANGVAGDTIQGGEVIDFNLYNTNPFGNLNTTPTASATSMFLKFDGIGAAEDMIVILKLYDATSGLYTTKAIMITNSDIQKGPGTGPGDYSSITLDNNDGLVIIESNDYNAPGENWVIVGAQIAGSDEGIIGTAINLNSAIGLTGDSDADNNGSLDTQLFSTDVNDGPFKISSIGFVTQNSTAQPATLNFNVTIQDADGDTVSQALVVNVVPPPPPVVLDTDHDGSIAYLGLDAGVLYDYDGDGIAESTAWVGGGDSILVRDADGNGTVSGASEFVFGGNGVTDLEALHAQYGEQLDASDADFVMFMLWNDANADGIADAGELQSLTDAGVTSIGLVSDGVASVEAGGDVLVAGQASYTYVNDNGDEDSGLVADVAFRTADRETDLAQRLAGAATNTGVVAAAVAAMGLATGQAAAHADPDVAGKIAAAAEAAGGPGVAVQVASDDGGLEANVSQLLSGNESRVSADDAQPTDDAGFAAPLQARLVDDTSDGADGSSDLLSATDSAANDDAAASPVAPMFVMPTAEALESLSGEGADGVQHGGTVEKVIAAALDGGAGGGDIDALLASLPGGGNSENAALDALATLNGGAVPGWDMGHAGYSHADALMNIVMDASALHPDAVQPAING